MVAESAVLSNTSAQSAALAAGRADTASAATQGNPRGGTLLESLMPKMKGFADGMNRFAEDSVSGVATLSERFLLRVAKGVETGKEMTEATQKGMHDFGKSVEEKVDFKQWELGTKERFPVTLAAVEENGDWVEKLAPLTAVGLVAEAGTQGASVSAPASERALDAEGQPDSEHAPAEDASDAKTPVATSTAACDVTSDLVIEPQKDVVADVDVASVIVDVVNVITATENEEHDCEEGAKAEADAVEAAKLDTDSVDEPPAKCQENSNVSQPTVVVQESDSPNEEAH